MIINVHNPVIWRWINLLVHLIPIISVSSSIIPSQARFLLPILVTLPCNNLNCKRGKTVDLRMFLLSNVLNFFLYFSLLIKNQNKKWVSMRFFLHYGVFNKTFVHCKWVLHKNYFCNMFFVNYFLSKHP